MSGRPCIFGEVLFDHFPDGRRVLGGAPFNVAWHLQAFGEKPLMITRVGHDDDGAAIRESMRSWGMETEGLQTDERLPTGCVQVRIDHGNPSYNIVHPAAWDAIQTPATMPDTSLLYHGSLALRSAASRRSWQSLRESQAGTVFVDVNLRAPWWQRERVLEDIEGADWVKLNREELEQLAPPSAPPRSAAEAFLRDHRLRGLLLTDGERGAQLLTADGSHWSARPQQGVAVTDTVGAGDALAAVMLLGLLRGWPLDISLERAQSFASAVVGQRGATVQDAGFYAAFTNRWSANAQGAGRGDR